MHTSLPSHTSHYRDDSFSLPPGGGGWGWGGCHSPVASLPPPPSPTRGEGERRAAAFLGVVAVVATAAGLAWAAGPKAAAPGKLPADHAERTARGLEMFKKQVGPLLA